MNPDALDEIIQYRADCVARLLQLQTEVQAINCQLQARADETGDWPIRARDARRHRIARMKQLEAELARLKGLRRHFTPTVESCAR